MFHLWEIFIDSKVHCSIAVGSFFKINLFVLIGG